MSIVLPKDPQEDPGWSGKGLGSLKYLKEKYNIRIEYAVTANSADAEDYFRKFAQAGHNFILGHSTVYTKGMEKVALEFPRTNFALTVHHPGNNRNLASVMFNNNEMGFLAGAAAALKSKTKKVAYITGPFSQGVRDIAEPFREGALHVDPKIQVSLRYLDSWGDSEHARAWPLELAKDGYDVIGSGAGGLDSAIIQQIRKAGVHAVGWGYDHHADAPETVITSCIQDFNLGIEQVFLLVQDGRFEGKLYRFGLLQEVQYLTPFRGHLTPDEEAIIEKIQKDLVSGKLRPYSHQ